MPIVEAAAVFANAKSKSLAGRIEQAMLKAIEQARADGVTDPKKVKARMLAAREKVKETDRK